MAWAQAYRRSLPFKPLDSTESDEDLKQLFDAIGTSICAVHMLHDKMSYSCGQMFKFYTKILVLVRCLAFGGIRAPSDHPTYLIVQCTHTHTATLLSDTNQNGELDRDEVVANASQLGLSPTEAGDFFDTKAKGASKLYYSKQPSSSQAASAMASIAGRAATIVVTQLYLPALVMAILISLIEGELRCTKLQRGHPGEGETKQYLPTFTKSIPGTLIIHRDQSNANLT